MEEAHKMRRKYALKITFLPKISKQVLFPGHNIWEEKGAGWRVTQPQHSTSKGLQEAVKYRQ